MARLKFSHAYDFAFEALSAHEDAEDVDGKKLRRALLKAVRAMSDEELLGACNRFDTAVRD